MVFLCFLKFYLDHLFRGALLKKKSIYSSLDIFLYMSYLFIV